MEDILQLQNTLQSDAQRLLKGTELLSMLSKLGVVTQTGSSVTGLMVYPDIDFAVQNPKPDVATAISLTQGFFEKLSASKVQIADFRNDKDETAGYYVGIDFPYDSQTWHIDATVGLPGPIVTNPPELTGWLDNMTENQRITILRLKKELLDMGRYVGSRSQPPYTFRSSHLYEAVFKGNAKTIKELESFYH